MAVYIAHVVLLILAFLILSLISAKILMSLNLKFGFIAHWSVMS